MKKLIALLFVLAACGRESISLTPSEQLIVDRILQIREMRTTAVAWWPEFDNPDYDTPLLYYTDSICYAANPTQRFANEFGGRSVYRDAGLEIYKTALPDSLAFHLETQMNFSDTTAYNARMPFLFCSSPEITAQTIPDINSDTLWLPMVLHEYMHGFQFRQPGFAAAFALESASVPESELAKLHKRCDWFDGAVEAENQTLLAALGATNGNNRDSCIRRFLTLRADRKTQMAVEFGDSTVRAEEIYELMEGGARFLEAQAGFRLGCYTQADKWLYDTAHSGYFYATGYNLVRLLDACGIDKSQLYTGHIHPLEDFLTTESGI